MVSEKKATEITRVVFSLPDWKQSLLALILLSFFSGAILYYLSSSLESEPILQQAIVCLWIGGSGGILVIGLPAILAALMCLVLASRKDLLKRFQQYAFVATVTALVISVGYISALASSKYLGTGPLTLVLLSNAIVLLAWFISLYFFFNLKNKAFFLSIIHPVCSLSLLVLWRAFDIIAIENVFLASLQLVASSLILLAGVGLLLYLLNAPFKRNFGISLIQTTTLFIAQWLYGSKGLEEVIDPAGENVIVPVYGAWFRRKSDKSVKAVFMVPCVHYGPVGNMGGSMIPSALADLFEADTGAKAFVFHGPTGHDLNPVKSDVVFDLNSAYLSMHERGRDYSDRLSFHRESEGKNSVFTLDFSGQAMMLFSSAPSNTDDIELTSGMVFQNAAIGSGFAKAVIVDCHNSKSLEGDFSSKEKISAGHASFRAYSRAMQKIERRMGAAFSMGIAIDPLSDCSEREGIGKAGLKVAVFKTPKSTACLVLLDANNCTPEFRDAVVRELRGMGFDECELLTTDNHSVNSMKQVHNPLSLERNGFLVSAVKRAVRKAAKDLEPCEASIKQKEVSIRVFGEGRIAEFLSTTSALISIAKILAPLIFFAALLLAVAAILFLGR